MGKSNADICRERGWGPGTVIEVNHLDGTMRLRITAVGETNILARQCGFRIAGRDWFPGYKERLESSVDRGIAGAVKVG